MFTEKFKKVLIQVILLSLFFSFLQELPNIIILSPDSKLRASSFTALLFNGVLWFGIAKLTRQKEYALSGFAIQNILLIAITIEPDMDLIIGLNKYLLILFLNVFAFTYFGYKLFGNKNGLWFGLIGLLHLNLGSCSSLLFELFNMIGIRGLVFIDIHLGEGKIYPLDILGSIYVSFRNVVLLILFNYAYLLLRKYEIKKVINLFDNIVNMNFQNRISFSIVFWLMRIGLLSLYGNLLLIRLTSVNSYLIFLIELTCFTFTFYVISIVYRNFLTSYFVYQKDKYPSWLYYFLNIPFFNIIAWAVLMLKHDEKNESTPLDEFEFENEVTKQNTVFRLKSNFENAGKNRWIKVLPYLGLSIVFFTQLVMMLEYHQMDGLMFLAITTAVAFTFLYFYLEHKNGLYYYLGYQIVLMILVSFFRIEFLVELISPQSMVMLIVLYPLFHFDKLKFESEENSKPIIEEE
jgi:hypothetical protein